MSPTGPVTAGIDIGTTSVKAVAVDATGTVVDRVRIPHRLLVPRPDRFEHDANRAWRRGPLSALHVLRSAAPAAVAVSSMVPSMTAVDDLGCPVAPGLLYGDERGGGDGGEGAGFLRWLAAAAPDAAGYWPAPAVANRALGGPGTVDIGTAFTSGPLYGPEGWDAELCAAYGVDVAKLPTVAMTGTPIGHVTGTDAILAAGGVDAMCEQLVAGADEPGDVLVVCGTTLIVWAVTDVEREVPGLWTIPHIRPGRWAIGGASNAGGLFLGWANRLTAPVTGGALDPGNVPVWAPYVRGERTPLHDPTRRAALHDLDLTHGAAAVERAGWEASGFVVRHHLDLAGVHARRIVAVGGGTQVPGWMQALADCTGLPVHVAAEPEGAAMGAAYVARLALGEVDGLDEASTWARTAGVVDPDPAWAAAADARYARFRSLS